MGKTRFLKDGNFSSAAPLGTIPDTDWFGPDLWKKNNLTVFPDNLLSIYVCFLCRPHQETGLIAAANSI